MFHDQKQLAPKAARVAPDDSTFHPLPALFKLIGLAPFIKVNCVLLSSPVRLSSSANALQKSINSKLLV